MIRRQEGSEQPVHPRGLVGVGDYEITCRQGRPRTACASAWSGWDVPFSLAEALKSLEHSDRELRL